LLSVRPISTQLSCPQVGHAFIDALPALAAMSSIVQVHDRNL
jgi:hypothetical protein